MSFLREFLSLLSPLSPIKREGTEGRRDKEKRGGGGREREGRERRVRTAKATRSSVSSFLWQRKRAHAANKEDEPPKGGRRRRWRRWRIYEQLFQLRTFDGVNAGYADFEFLGIISDNRKYLHYNVLHIFNTSAFKTPICASQINSNRKTRTRRYCFCFVVVFNYGIINILILDQPVRDKSRFFIDRRGDCKARVARELKYIRDRRKRVLYLYFF